MRNARVPVFTAKELKALAAALAKPAKVIPLPLDKPVVFTRAPGARPMVATLGRYIIYGQVPTGKNRMQIRHRRTALGKRVAYPAKSDRATQWIADAQLQLMRQTGAGFQLIAHPVRVDASFYLTRDVDKDNLLASLYDAIKGVVLVDDKHITDGSQSKQLVRDKLPRVEFVVGLTYE